MPRALAVERRNSLGRTVAAVVWARRWKLAATLFAVGLVKACAWGPEWMQPFCEALAALAKVLP